MPGILEELEAELRNRQSGFNPEPIGFSVQSPYQLEQEARDRANAIGRNQRRDRFMRRRNPQGILDELEAELEFRNLQPQMTPQQEFDVQGAMLGRGDAVDRDGLPYSPEVIKSMDRDLTPIESAIGLDIPTLWQSMRNPGQNLAADPSEMGSVTAGIMDAGAGFASLGQRLFGGLLGDANQTERDREAMMQAHQMAVADSDQSGTRQWLNRNLPGVTSSLTQVAGLSPLAEFTGGQALGFGTLQANQSYSSALEAGLSPVDALEYAMLMGAVEGGIMQGFEAVGLGGTEKKLAQAGVDSLAGMTGRQVAKEIGKRQAQELAEELLTTTAQQGVGSQYLPGQENALSLRDREGNLSVDSPLGGALVDTASQVGLTAGITETPQVAARAITPTLEAWSKRREEANFNAGVEAAKQFVAEPSRRHFKKLPTELRPDQNLKTQEERQQWASVLAANFPEFTSGAPAVTDAATEAPAAEEAAGQAPVAGGPALDAGAPIATVDVGNNATEVEPQADPERLLESLVPAAPVAEQPTPVIQPPVVDNQAALSSADNTQKATDGQEASDAAAAQGRQEGREEGLLMPPASGSEFEQFRKEYIDTFQKMMQYEPDQSGSRIYADRLAQMSDSNPGWVSQIENESPAANPAVAAESGVAPQAPAPLKRPADSEPSASLPVEGEARPEASTQVSPPSSSQTESSIAAPIQSRVSPEALVTSASEIAATSGDPLVLLGDLRKEFSEESGVTKPEFDRAVFDAAKAGKIGLHVHDFPGSLTPEEQSRLVINPDNGRAYIGATVRQPQLQDVKSTTPEPKQDSELPKLIEKYQPLIRSIFKGRVSPDLVDDLTNDVNVKVLSSGSSRDTSKPFAPWVKSIARNVLTDHFRKQGRSKVESVPDVPEVATSSEPANLLTASQGSLQERLENAYLAVRDPLPFAPNIAKSNAKRLAHVIESREYDDIVAPNNKQSRKFFEVETGKKLPPTVGTTKKFFQDWKAETAIPQADARNEEQVNQDSAGSDIAMPSGYELVAPGSTPKSLSGMETIPSKLWEIVAPGGFTVGKGNSPAEAFESAKRDPEVGYKFGGKQAEPEAELDDVEKELLAGLNERIGKANEPAAETEKRPLESKSPAKEEAQSPTKEQRSERSSAGRRTEAAVKRKEEKFDAALDAFRDAFRDEIFMGVPLDPKKIKATLDLTQAAVELGVAKFADFVTFIAEKIGEDAARRAGPYFEKAWKVLPRVPGFEHVDAAGRVDEILNKGKPNVGDRAESEADQGGTELKLAEEFAQFFKEGKSFASIVEARKFAGQVLGGINVATGTRLAKTVDESIELGVVFEARRLARLFGVRNATQVYESLVDLYQRQPVLGTRTSTSMLQQAYSTPAPLAYVASRLAGIGPMTQGIYEPTAGNGMLLVGVSNTDYAIVNELNPGRARRLRSIGFEVTENDATEFSPTSEITRVIANPPFGRVKEDDGKTAKEWTVGGITTKEIDHAIALRALESLPPKGMAVLILGAKGHNAKDDLQRRRAYLGPARQFYETIYDKYGVIDHFTVAGDLYSRQGAGFPVDVIVIDLAAQKLRPYPWAEVPAMFDNWEGLKEKLRGPKLVTVGNARERNNGGASAEVGTDAGMDVVSESAGRPDPQSGNVGVEPRLEDVPAGVVGTSWRGRGKRGDSQSRNESGIRDDAGKQQGGAVDVSGRPEESSAGETESQPGQSDARPGKLADGVSPKPIERVAQPEQQETEFQTNYKPASNSQSVGTLVPANHATSVQAAMDSVRARHGEIDQFVASELGYQVADIPKFFSAEQVDALALVIDNHQRGYGFVIGDQTGVGKGRVNAGVIRYANRRGLVPLFLTEKPDLFGDIIRDLQDIGEGTVDSPFEAIVINDTAGDKAISRPDGLEFKASGATSLKRLDEAIDSLASGNGFKASVGKESIPFRAVFATYSQLRTVQGKEPARRATLRRLIPSAFFILDESHNAGGASVSDEDDRFKKKDAPPNGAEFVRELVGLAGGVFYSSATFAKRPDVMDVYSRTSMSEAVNGDVSQLPAAIEAGGVPLQQIVSQMLVESGQYLRREKSFEGIEIAPKVVSANLKEADEISSVFREIRQFDKAIEEIVSVMQDEITAGGGTTIRDTAIGDAGVSSTSFSSLLWNAVDQMLFALKADQAANEAIEAFKRGEKPVIAVDNTLESLLNEYAEGRQLKVGDRVNLRFNDVLQRYVDRSRVLNVNTGMKDAKGKNIVEKIEFSDADLDRSTKVGNALEIYRRILAKIDELKIDAPASPIDWMRYRLEQAGIRVREVTGRKTMVRYSENGVATLESRPDSESGVKGKQATIFGFNSGEVDAIILNRSGSTGLSIHASGKFQDQRRRHMIIAQAAKNIDEFMQMLGRINRTGQVVKNAAGDSVLPRYTVLMTDSPAEIRPAAVLSKKLSSLNANVTAKSKGNVSIDVPDIINEVGGKVIAEYLREHDELAKVLDVTLDSEDGETMADEYERIARQATGRAASLTVDEQREFYDTVTTEYEDRIKQLDAMNMNPLKAQTLPLAAETLERFPIFEGDEEGGPFAQPAYLERVRSKVLGKPLSEKELTASVTEFYSIEDLKQLPQAASEWSGKTRQELERRVADYIPNAIARLVDPEAIAARKALIFDQVSEVKKAIEDFSPGSTVSLFTDFGIMNGVVTRVKVPSSKADKNPAAPSAWKFEIAIDDSSRTMTVSARVMSKSTRSAMKFHEMAQLFERSQSLATEQRWVATGNVLAAFGALKDERGSITFFTDKDGETRSGILLPRSFGGTAYLERRPVVLENSADVMRFFKSGGLELSTPDGALSVRQAGETFVLTSPKARSRGGRYTLNKGILDAASPAEFISRGNRMELSVPMSQASAVVNAVLNANSLQAVNGSDREVGRYVLGLGKTSATRSADSLIDLADEERARRVDPDVGGGRAFGIVPPSMVGPTPRQKPTADDVNAGTSRPATQKEIDDAVRQDSEEVRKRIANSDKVPRPDIKARIAEFVEDVAGLTRQFKHIPNKPKFAKYIEVLRLMGAVRESVSDQVTRYLAAILDPIPASVMQVFTLKLLYENELHAQSLGQLKHYGFTSPEEVQKELDKVNALIQKPSFASVRESLKRREEVRRDVVQKLVDLKMLDQKALENDKYFHQQVLFYSQAMRQVTGQTPAPLRRGFQIKRSEEGEDLGSAFDPNSNYLESEAAWLTDALVEIRKAELLSQLGDDMPKLKAEAKRRNYVAVVGGQDVMDRIEKIRGEMAELREAGGFDNRVALKHLSDELWELDPTMTYRARMAKALDDMMKDIDQNKHVDSAHDSPMTMAQKLADAPEGTDGRGAAIAFLAAAREREEFMEKKLGKNHLTWQKLLREKPDLAAWHPHPKNVFYRTLGLTEKAQASVMAELLTNLEAGATVKLEDLRQITALATGKDPIILPAQVVKQLESMERPVPRSPVAKAFSWPVTAWKWFMTVGNPLTVGKYMLSNQLGDFDVVLAGAPGANLKVQDATTQLYKYYYKNDLAISNDLRAARDFGVISSSLAADEIKEIHEVPVLRRFARQGGSIWDIPGNVLGKIEKFNETRESILRLATFLHFKEGLKNGTLKYYAASNPEAIKQIMGSLGVDAAAAKMSRDLMGDYGALSTAGNFLRRYVFPFWAFSEINMRRYKNLAVNAYRAGIGQSGLTGSVMTAAMLMRIAAWHAGIMMMNWLLWPEEEQELSVDDRYSPHVNLGRADDGHIRIMRNSSAFGELLEWAGLNQLPGLMQYYQDGQMSFERVVEELWHAPINKAAQMLNPYAKTGDELLTGQSRYPDVFNPRSIDTDTTVANLFRLEDENKILNGMVYQEGDRARPHYWERKFIGVVDPRTNAIGEMHDLRNKFLTEIEGKKDAGKNSYHQSPTRKMRRAAEAEDWDAFLEAKSAYEAGGGSARSFFDSIRRIDPISERLSDEKEKRFESEFLTPQQKTKLKTARDFARELECRLALWWGLSDESSSKEKDAYLSRIVNRAADPVTREEFKAGKREPSNTTVEDRERLKEMKVTKAEAIKALNDYWADQYAKDHPRERVKPGFFVRTPAYKARLREVLKLYADE